MDFLNEYIVPVIVGLCLVIGFIIKQWVDDIDNKWIPTIVTLAGIFFSMWLNSWMVTPEILLTGAISGLTSTGCHQLFKSYVEKSN